MGYFRAGFQGEIVGVDICPQPNYPFEFIQADALEYAADHAGDFDAVHASPPCQQFSRLSNIWIARLGKEAWRKKHPDLISPIREILKKSGKPYIIENVEGAPLLYPVMLCGTMFNLKTYRHRLFESNVLLLTPPHTKHRDSCPGAGRGFSSNGFITLTGNPACSLQRAGEAIGIDWMTKPEIAQAVPPAYTEYLGRQLIKPL